MSVPKVGQTDGGAEGQPHEQGRVAGAPSQATSRDDRDGNDEDEIGIGGEMDEIAEKERQLSMAMDTDKTAHHERWLGSNLDKKGDQIGLRAGNNNFHRKLYASKANIAETVVNMKAMNMDLLLGTEPGQGTPTNITLFKNTLRQYGFDAVTVTRDQKTIGGGLTLIMSEKWARIPRVKRTYTPKARDERGRAMAVVFNNKVEGMHNKVQVIGVHGLNGAELQQEASIALLQWVAKEKASFELECPLGTTIMMGDLNAAVNTYLDTDRHRKEDREEDKDEEEKDAFIIRTIEEMKLVDVFRGRYPVTRAVTRNSTEQTNRLLDRIMVTAEAAAHPTTEIAIHQEQFLTAGSDHLMIVIDLPIDTAGVANDRVKIWEPRKVVKWVRDTCDLGKIAKEKEEELNEELHRAGDLPTDFAGWAGRVMGAAQGTVLRRVETRYPKRATTKESYTPEDRKLRANLRALRFIHTRVTQQEEHPQDRRRTVVIANRRVQAVAGTIHGSKEVQLLLKKLKGTNRDTATSHTLTLIKTTEEHLRKKNRTDRAAQIRKSVTLRNNRFNDKGKLMLKLVINSLMRRHSEKEEITAVTEGEHMRYEEKDVKRVVKEFYESWMESRVHVTDRFDSWRDMQDLNTNKLKHPRHKRLIEEAYSESSKKYKKLQKEEGIWDGVRSKTNLRELKETIKAMKKGTAAGPTGLTYDILGMLTDEHLGPLVEILNRALESAKVEQEMNRSLLRPLPKTDQGLADLAKTRPIALMETALKVLERIIYSRVMKVVQTQAMLRKEQHGSLAGRSVKAPIRVLTEVIEDAIISGKELHVFSADISKAFDSLEYWSQAMGWSALGMPPDLVDMLVEMDAGGETAIVLGQGRVTDWFKSGRGVRQGSIGGPIKWVVFMNFWLEYVYKVAQGEGYRMSEAEERDEELLGQMFVDDSNWVGTSHRAMTLLVELGQEFAEFHGLKFNKDKCEYLVLNQERGRRGKYDLPTWDNGDGIEPKMRHAKDTEAEREISRRAAARVRDLSELALDDEEEVEWYPGEEEYADTDREVKAWMALAQKGHKDEAQMQKERTIEKVNQTKATIYGELTRQEWERGTREWARDMTKALDDQRTQRGGEGKATKYLGVRFELNLKWKVQREALERKFRDMQTRIGSSKPNREQAIYCVNAVINAAIKYPLQVASIPKSTLHRWDTANRGVVRRAGALPRQISGLMHVPKSEGGVGLQSLVSAVEKERVADQVAWLNSETTTGQIVRAAHRRWVKNGDREKGTLQYHSMRAVEDIGAVILQEVECSMDMWGRTVSKRNYDGKVRQIEKDIESATLIGRTREAMHAFGDGATWADEGRSGWATVRMGGGREAETVRGRVPGKQTNDAAETRAILQALLETNPRDELTIYCDNQGCVDIWNREGNRGEAKENNTQNRAMWIRIDGMRRHRQAKGAKTTMEWVHSHVDDEQRRADVSRAKYRCACGGEGGCTRPGEEGHWVHEGNEVADEEAKSGSKEGLPEASQVRAGELRFVLANAEVSTDSAQSSYKDWIDEEQWEIGKRVPSKARELLEAIREVGSNKATRTLTKSLHQQGNTTWRFWSRTLMRCLPTHSQMAKFAGSSETNAYRTVYQDELGAEGRCIRCGHGKETTEHAILECTESAPRWQRLQHELEQIWEHAGEDWTQTGWLENTESRYPGWKHAWTITGIIPREAVNSMQDGGLAAIKLLNEAAKLILDTAFKAWEARNSRVQEWIESNPELKERKMHADRTGWRSESNKRKPRGQEPDAETDEEESQEGKADTRYKRIKGQTDKEIEKQEAEKEKVVDKQMKAYEEACKRISRLPAHPAELARVKKKKLRQALKDFKTMATQKVARARYAQGTRDIKTTELTRMTMLGTQPAVSTESRPHFWIPRVNQEVEALWTDCKGTKAGNLRGRWWKGRVVRLEWPADKGTPGVVIQYADGMREWHGIDTCNVTVRPRTQPKGANHKPFDTMFPKEAVEWLGIGSRLAVKWIGAGWPEGTVVGTDRHGTMVRYSDGSAVAHKDLHTRGCKIKEFRRPRDQRLYYQERPWEQCPYEGEEEDCECWPCHSVKWPRICRECDLTDQQRDTLLGLQPWDRMGGINEIIKNRLSTDDGGLPLANSQQQPDTHQHEQGTRGSSDRDPTQETDPREQGPNENPEVAWPEGDQHEQQQQTDRPGESRQGLGMDSTRGETREAFAQEQGIAHAAMDESGRDRGAHSACGGRMVRGSRGEEATRPGRDEGISTHLGKGERGGPGIGPVDLEAPEAAADAGGKESDGEATRRDTCDARDLSGASCRQRDSARKEPQQEPQRGAVGDMGHGHNAVDVARRLGADSSRGPEDGTGCGAGYGAKPTPMGSGERAGGHGHRGGVGEHKDGNQGPDARNKSHRGGQTRAHEHRQEEWGDSGGSAARPDSEGGDGPVRDAGEEGGRDDVPLDLGLDVIGVLLHVCSKRDQSGNRLSPRGVCSISTEQEQGDTREDGAGGGIPRRDGDGPGECGPRTGSEHTGQIRPGEPNDLEDVDPPSDEGSHGEEPRVEAQTSGPVRLRAQIPEANAHTNQSAGVGTDRDDRQRQVQDRQLRGHNRKRGGGQEARGADGTEHQGEETEAGKEVQRKMGVHKGSSSKRRRGGPDHRDPTSCSQRKRSWEQSTLTDPQGPPRGPKPPPAKRTSASAPERDPTQPSINGPDSTDQSQVFDPGD